jgi:hypothetical protein
MVMQHYGNVEPVMEIGLSLTQKQPKNQPGEEIVSMSFGHISIKMAV